MTSDKGMLEIDPPGARPEGERAAVAARHARRGGAAPRPRGGPATRATARPFSVDVDRILSQQAYARYIDKTQVFYHVHNDHITTGSSTSIVSEISRTIGRSLGLNKDPIEAIALGHDIGHTRTATPTRLPLGALLERGDRRRSRTT